VVDESSGPGSDFLAKICIDWEAESRPALELGCRLVVLRTGREWDAARPLERLTQLLGRLGADDLQ
jgi:NAD dependent epimerase/dehydratase family enzyme